MNAQATRLVVLALLLMPLTVWAGGKTGFYVGGGVGQSKFQVDATNPSGNYNLDDNANAGKKSYWVTILASFHCWIWL
jgi:hypothetical protein